MKLQKKTRDVLGGIKKVMASGSGPLTKADMAIKTGCDKAKINSFVTRGFLEADEAVDKTSTQSSTGRPSKVKKYKISSLGESLLETPLDS